MPIFIPLKMKQTSYLDKAKITTNTASLLCELLWNKKEDCILHKTVLSAKAIFLIV